MDNDITPLAHSQAVAQRLGLWADILRDCSARGLRFASNIYDQDNYRNIQLRTL